MTRKAKPSIKAKTAPPKAGAGRDRAGDARAVPTAGALLPENLPAQERIERENDRA